MEPREGISAAGPDFRAFSDSRRLSTAARDQGRRGPERESGHVSSITVVKRDGSREPYDANKINLAIESAAEGLDPSITWVTQIASELELTLFDGITTQQLDEAVIQVALQNVKDDPAFDVVAARLLLRGSDFPLRPHPEPGPHPDAEWEP